MYVVSGLILATIISIKIKAHGNSILRQKLGVYDKDNVPVGWETMNKLVFILIVALFSFIETLK